jgi:hypothetical protein
LALLVSQIELSSPFPVHLVIAPNLWSFGYSHPMARRQVGYKRCNDSTFMCLSNGTAHESMRHRSKSTASEQISSERTASARACGFSDLVRKRDTHHCEMCGQVANFAAPSITVARRAAGVHSS